MTQEALFTWKLLISNGTEGHLWNDLPHNLCTTLIVELVREVLSHKR